MANFELVDNWCETQPMARMKAEDRVIIDKKTKNYKSWVQLQRRSQRLSSENNPRTIWTGICKTSSDVRWEMSLV